MEADPKISVVVPVYNRGALLERCLESIWRQEVRPLEILIVDNNSTDDSREVARTWRDRHSEEEGLYVILIEEKRQGAARARQTGAEQARAPRLFFMDSDDEMEPGILPAALEVSDEYDMVYWRLKETGIDGNVRMRHFSRRKLWQRQMYNAMFCTQSYLVRKDFFMAAGGWDTTTRVWDDLELGMRLLLHRPTIIGIRKTGVKIFRQAESITGLDFLSRKGEWERTLDIMERRIRDYASQRKMHRKEEGSLRLPGVRVMLETVDYRRVNLAALYHREGDSCSARRLLEKTMRESGMSPLRRLFLRMLYSYTLHGGRGAYLLWH